MSRGGARVKASATQCFNQCVTSVAGVMSRAGAKTANRQRFKRFVGAELILHWVNAVPFVVLMVTGGVMLASRFCHIDRSFFTRVVTVHKAFAFSWLIVLPFVVLLDWKVHWLHLRVMLSWGAEDLVWMTQSVRALYNKKAIVPPAGRFNTGQKMNACLVIFYFFSFAATGILMCWKGSILVPWYVHTALFCAAMSSVGGHLFLALINPGTRIALAGIFHGWSPMEYVKHHHPLSIPIHETEHIAAISPKKVVKEVFSSKMEIVMLALPLVMAGVGCAVFSKGQLASAKQHFAKSFAECIKPSDLSTRHRIGPVAESCTQCHSYAGSLSSAKCEKCHNDVKERRTAAIGYHGTLKGECITCHKEHLEASKSIVPLVREKFDHNQAQFKREGRHAGLECDECHKKKRSAETPGVYYIGLKFASCTDCHRDPHAGQFAANCTQCHTLNGWKGKELKFSHEADSPFKLTQKHIAVECVKCHKPKAPGTPLAGALFKGLSTECASCHEEPHRKQFSANCTGCHSPAGWTGKALAFDHSKDSKFPLVAKHGEVACEKCHLPEAPGQHLGTAQFRGLKSGCADCHKEPHRGQLGATCVTCHPTPASWKVDKLHFEHDRDTKYPLTGKHASIECVKCHKPEGAIGKLGSATFKGLGTSCDACHKVNHPQAYGPTCVSCHTTDRMPKKNPGVEHILKPEFSGQHLGGKHLTADCSACHQPSRLGAAGQSANAVSECYTCHAKDDPHKGALGQNCAKCHSISGWKGDQLLFNHDAMTRFAMDQDHKKLACSKCHENGHWKLETRTCVSCHPKLYDKSKP